jgi:hypothetical protein
MKKLLLLSLLVAFASFASGQDTTFYENFNSELPNTWTIIDSGDNDTTWTHDGSGGLNGSGGVWLDTYVESQPNYGKADDWLISPQITGVQSNDLLSFYVKGGYSSDFSDSVTVMVSKSGTAESDFTIHLGGQKLIGSGSYLKWQTKLSAHDDITAGDDLYIGIHCESNGSEVFLDQFKVAPYQFPGLTEAYNLDKNTLNVVYDGEVATDSITVDDYKLVSGADTITFGNYTIDDSNNKLVHLTEASAEMIGDNVLDTLHFKETQYVFYAGLTPIEFTSLTNPDGTMEVGYNATFTGIIIEKDKSGDRVWIADKSGAHNSINTYGGGFYSAAGKVGDSIKFYGPLDLYDNQSEIFKPIFIETLSSDNSLYDPVSVTGSELDTSITADSDPAEQYEGSLVKIENLTIDAWDGTEYFYGHTSNDDTIRIGDRLDIYDQGFGDTTLNVGESYTISGIVVGRSGEYQISPRDVYDIIPLDDATSPQVTCEEQNVTNMTGETVNAKSNESGWLYIILDGEPHSTVAELDAAVESLKGARAKAAADQPTSISVADLQEGTYYAYAVDRNGNISDKSVNSITIESAAFEVPYVQDFEDSLNMPANIVLNNRDGGVPATGLEIYQSLAEEAFKVVPTDTLSTNDFGDDNENIVVGTSWYKETIDADDWLILPKVKLTDYTVLSWDALSLTTSGDYPDGYEVYVSTTHQTVEACMKNEPVFSISAENVSTDADNPGDGVAHREVNLAEKGFTNESVYVAFRLNTPNSGGDRLGLDNIKFFEPDTSAPKITTSSDTVIIGNDAYVQSSEASGKVYIILESEPQSTTGELETAVNVGTAASAEVTAANTDIAISTSGLTAGTYYAYAVDSSKNMSGKSSNAITLVESETGIDDDFSDGNISIYPNPVNDKLQFTSNVQISKVTIYNTLGQKVIEKTVVEENMTINTSDLKDGIYFMNFENEEKQIKTVKFIKE